MSVLNQWEYNNQLYVIEPLCIISTNELFTFSAKLESNFKNRCYMWKKVLRVG